MAVSYRIDEDLVEIVVVGEVTVDDVIGQIHASVQDPDLRPPTHLLLNVTESELLPHKEDVPRLAAALAAVQHQMGGRIAVLVAHPVRFGLARQISAFLRGDGVQLMPFLEREQACLWLQGHEES